MSTNHKPEIPDGSEAIWDRMVLIPFNQRFEGAKADEDLPEKLREELPGVLAWAVMGCVEWYQHGLGSSVAVDRATSSYRSETDPLERFLDEMCEFEPELRVPKTEMYDAYVQWCTEEYEEAKGTKGFAQMMNEKGVVKNFHGAKSGANRIWRGVSLGGNRPTDGGWDTSSETQKSCKQMGGESSEGHFEENSEKISLDVPREGEFSENRLEVSQSVQSVPDVLTTPLSLEEDGMEIEYMPEEE
jgi:phage/plasmid-associated DNA primase